MDEPQSPHWLVDFNKSVSIEEIANGIIDHLKGRELK